MLSHTAAVILYLPLIKGGLSFSSLTLLFAYYTAMPFIEHLVCAKGSAKYFMHVIVSFTSPQTSVRQVQLLVPQYR